MISVVILNIYKHDQTSLDWQFDWSRLASQKRCQWWQILRRRKEISSLQQKSFSSTSQSRVHSLCSGGTKTLLNSANISCSGKSSVQFKSEDLPGVTQAFITSGTYIQVTQHLVESCNPFGVKELASSKVTQPSQQISKNNFNGIINSIGVNSASVSNEVA